MIEKQVSQTVMEKGKNMRILVSLEATRVLVLILNSIFSQLHITYAMQATVWIFIV